MKKETFLIGFAFIIGAMSVYLTYTIKKEYGPSITHEYVVNALVKACTSSCSVKNIYWNNKIVIENGNIDCECVGKK